MGQQQLLLTILVVVIVGIATIFAISIFAESAEQSSFDAVTQDMAMIAASSQTWYIRPAFMGGGNNAFGNLNFNSIQFSGKVIEGSGGFIASNANGTYWIRSAGSNSFTIRAFPASLSGYVEGATPGTGWLEARVTRNSIVLSPALDVLPPVD